MYHVRYLTYYVILDYLLIRLYHQTLVALILLEAKKKKNL